MPKPAYEDRGQVRSYHLGIRLTPEEHDKLKQVAELRGLSVGEMCRRFLIDWVTAMHNHKVDKKTTRDEMINAIVSSVIINTASATDDPIQFMVKITNQELVMYE